MIKERYSTWKYISWSLSILLILPIVCIFYLSIGQHDALFQHLFETVLPHYILNTVIIVFGTTLLASVFALPAAWFMAMCEIPGKKILQWLLVLPLAMPSYIIGYIYTDWFDFAGPIQVWLRHTYNLSPDDYWFFDLRTLPGAVIILALALYPYIYLLARTAFMEQSITLLHSARLLNCSAWQSFFKVSLPLARPAIVVGMSLVAMEALGDYGTVSYFAVSTLTTAIYDTWLNYSNLAVAAKISSLMLIAVILILAVERYSRRKQKHFQSSSSWHQKKQYVLTKKQLVIALIWCWGLVFTGFLLPMFQLITYAFHYMSQNWTTEFAHYTINSLKVSFSVAFLCIILSLTLSFYQRLTQQQSSKNSQLSTITLRLSSLGYAVPGTVLAIGIMFFVLTIEHGVNDFAKWIGQKPPGLIFSGTMLALILALCVRFSAISIGTIETGLSKISPNLDMAAKTMGCSTNKMLRKVHIPLITRGILVAGLLVFIEVMKELNASLLLRPFNFETLATYIYNFASDQALELAAIPAILLVLVGLIPLIIINRHLNKVH